MINYGDYWKPETIDRAKWLIDTTFFGSEFFEMGKVSYERMKPHAPAACQTVVDYGCGIGRVLACWEGVKNRIGIDVSDEMLNYARELFPDCKFIKGNGNEIPLDDNSVDFVYSQLVLQHMVPKDIRAVLAETRRVLKPTGSCWHLFAGLGHGWREDLEFTHCHQMIACSPDIINDISKSAGLVVYEIKKIDDYYAMIGGTA